MTRSMRDEELLRVWQQGVHRAAWGRVRVRASADGDAVEVARAEQAARMLPEPLVALAASADLVRRVVEARWQVIMLAREGGASWEQVAEALGGTRAAVVAAYVEAISVRERYVLGHDVARARAVLDEPSTRAVDR